MRACMRAEHVKTGRQAGVKTCVRARGQLPPSELRVLLCRRQDIYLMGGWNRWTHPRPFGPIKMEPPPAGEHHFRVGRPGQPGAQSGLAGKGPACMHTGVLPGVRVHCPTLQGRRSALASPASRSQPDSQRTCFFCLRLRAQRRGCVSVCVHDRVCARPAVQATIPVPKDAYKMDFVFSDVASGPGTYDNRGGFDYHLPVEGCLFKERSLHVVHISVEMAPIAKVPCACVHARACVRAVCTCA